MIDDVNYMTPEGFKKIADEMEFLARIERPKTVQEVSDAAAQGDRSENAEYIYGKKRLREIDRRLNFLSSRLKNVQVVDPKTQSGDKVFFGATVVTEDEDGNTRTWRIVGVDETEPSEGKISWRSPLGRVLMKRRVGDTVTVQKPTGDAIEHTLLEIRYE